MLSNLRKQPEEVRRQIALFVTLIVAVLLVIIWASIFKNSNTFVEKTEGEKAPGPFSVLWQTFSNTASGIKDSVSDTAQSIKGTFSSEDEIQ